MLIFIVMTFTVLFIVFVVFMLLKYVRHRRYWHGPAGPKNSPWVTDHLIEFNAPDLAKAFPQEAETAQAVRRYNEIEILHNAGKMSDSDYETELDKLMPLIHIDDITGKE